MTLRLTRVRARARSDQVAQILANFRAFSEEEPTRGAALGRVADLAETTDPALHSERQWEIHAWLQAHPTLAVARSLSLSLTLTSTRTPNAWLQAHPRVRRWVALDDEELIEGQPNAARAAEFVGRAVRTESHVGLTDADAELAISLLARQPV